MKKSRLVQNRRMMILLAFAVAIFAALAVRTAWIQIVNGEELSRKALEQQTSDNTVSAKRGNIFDRNYKVLASNTSVETISITPADLRESIETNRTTVSRVAEEIANRLGLKKETVENKINKASSFEYLKKKVEKDVADDLRTYIEDNNLRGISFVEDVKRFYPYNNMASHVIGFVGDDNQGLEGIESIYDEELSGVPGRVITSQQTTGLDNGSSYESYIEAQDGCSVVLTIDEVIQGYVEKHLENARISNKLEEGAAAIVMDVNSGEILAMSSKPDYDLNEPFAITDALRDKYDGIDEELEKLEGTDYTTRLSEVIQTVRRNKAVVDSYEPGSTFKAMVASLALETGAVSLNDTFGCSGSYRVLDRSINCANHNGHGTQSFAETVQNSCNPGFIQIGAKIGKERFLTGARAFGFFQKTGIELPGETTGLGFTLDNFTELDLATSSFGQSITVTPLQMITAISAVANGGKLYKPHVVKEIINSENIVVEKNESQVVRQVISKETSETMRTVLESVVSKGGGKNAYIAGYRVAGKTGTSEKYPRGNGKYVASFISFAPADDPKVACLVILDQPASGMAYYGGTIAAPVVKNILEETLQYMEVEPRYNEEEKAYVDIELPDLSGKTKEEATALLKEAGFSIRFKGEGDAVTDQIPKAYTRLGAGSTVVAYLNGTKAERTVTIPNVVGESAASAAAMITGEGLNARIRGVPGGGSAICSSQSPEAGTIVEPGTVVTLNFKYQGATE
ncbi:MAG: penicillin-binding transpeptidase domain-containing protein [Clostridia bacterium]|nr:penicillin-binding transpeptidase domain-containing protein [Clostridia bacterium]